MKRLHRSFMAHLMILFCASVALNAAIPAGERNALIALYNATGGDSWTNNSGWKTAPLHTDGFAMPGTEGEWYGITVEGDHVAKIDFPYVQTGGTLVGNNLIGPIPPELAGLTHLSELSMIGNKLSGAIPTQLGAMNNLTHLYLSYNELSGDIPPELGLLANLKELSLSRNKITGSIPAEFGNLTELTYLSLHTMQLSGGIPAALGNLTKLEILALQRSQLTGSIPIDLGNLANLEQLALSENQLTGVIPAELGNLTNLQYLYLHSNQLTGSIPPQLGNLTNLQYLYLHSNQLTGSIPPQLGNLTNLQLLGLFLNQLTSVIPVELGNLTNLQYLWLDENQLTGVIPAELGNLTQLQELILSGNQLTGVIPGELGSLTNLQYLWLDGNQLTGVIPGELGSLTNLIQLGISGNQLTGSFPVGLGILTNLQYLWLSTNQLSGDLPVEIGNLTKLRTLDLKSNQFTGAIPPQLGNLAGLQKLDLQNNQLSGPIPTEIGNLTALTHLYLNNNVLSGTIPNSMTSLINVTHFGINYNCLQSSDPTLRAWLSSKQPDWETHQDQCTVTIGNLSGRVTNTSGEGIQNIRVNIYTSTNEFTQINYAYTDSGGNYTVPGLPAGNYKTFFFHNGLNFISEWYNDKTTFSAADTVVVTGGNTTPDINAQLAPSSTGSISGRVTNTSGVGIQNIKINLYDVSGLGSEFIIVKHAYTDETGSYIFSGLTAKSYKVEFFNNGQNYASKWYNNKSTYATADPVAVTAGTTTPNINTQLAVGGSISGQVANLSSVGISNIKVQAYTNNVFGIPTSEVMTDANGNYLLRGLPAGNVKVLFDNNGQNFVSEWYNNKSTLATSDAVPVTSGNTTSNINAQLAVGGTISGRVTNSSGNGISGAFPELYYPQGCDITSRSVRTDGNGDYSFQGLPTGTFTVYFSPGSLRYAPEWYNKKTKFQTPDPIQVTAGSTTANIDAVLTDSGTVGGKITDSTSAGIANAWVSVYNMNNVLIDRSSTFAGGSYRIYNIPTGNVKILISKTGFIPQWYSNKTSFAAADTVVISTSYNEINAVLEPESSVTISGNAGVAGATLSWTDGTDMTATADGSGAYSFSVSYNWSGTVTPTLAGYAFTPANRTYTDVTSNRTEQDYSAVMVQPPAIGVNRTRLNFGSVIENQKTDNQLIVVSNTGGGTLDWTAAGGAGWLDVAPVAGSDTGMVTVSVNPAGLAAGTYTSQVMLTAPGASNSPRTVDVALNVYPQGGSAAPFGSFDTPANGATVFGAIPVTGWALDDVQVQKVEVKRSPHPTDPAGTIGQDGLVFISNAIFVEGARPDVETAFPQSPLQYRAGWGYMLLTNMLPNQGNDAFTIHAFAYDKEGTRVNLGQKTITGNNAGAVKPFGAIDTPGQGEQISGAVFNNFGWALTPQPNMIPTDGSTIRVWVDGVSLGHPAYNYARPALAALFPGLANTNGPVGLYVLDTTAYENGVHTIAWSVVDNGGNADGIGSRFFSILNAGGAEIEEAGESVDKTPGSQDGLKHEVSAGGGALLDRSVLDGLASNMTMPVYVMKGYGPNQRPDIVYPDLSGVVDVAIEEVERVEVLLGAKAMERAVRSGRFSGRGAGAQSHTSASAPQDNSMDREFGAGALSGYLAVGDELRPLPIGSTLDPASGAFAWQPGPGFLGAYTFVFVREGQGGIKEKTVVRITIVPRF